MKIAAGDDMAGTHFLRKSAQNVAESPETEQFRQKIENKLAQPIETALDVPVFLQRATFEPVKSNN